MVCTCRVVRVGFYRLEISISTYLNVRTGFHKFFGAERMACSFASDVKLPPKELLSHKPYDQCMATWKFVKVAMCDLPSLRQTGGLGFSTAARSPEFYPQTPFLRSFEKREDLNARMSHIFTLDWRYRWSREAGHRSGLVKVTGILLNNRSGIDLFVKAQHTSGVAIFARVYAPRYRFRHF